MPVDAHTHSCQTTLASYCRTGEPCSLEGARSDRLPVYRRLVGNVMTNTLSNAYPIAYEALGEERWEAFISEFCAQHKAESPYLWRFPYELYQFALDHQYADQLKLPYLNDLLLFEWLEIELFMMPDAPVPLARSEGDVLSSTLILNPEQRLTRLEYPVFRLPPEELAKHRGLYFLLSYRHPESLEVEFIELAAPFALAIEYLGQGELCSTDLWDLVATHFPSLDRSGLQQQGVEFLKSMLDKRVLLGFGAE